MKKTFIFFVLVFSFAVLFCLCCFAADVQSSYNLTDIPLGRNIAQVPNDGTSGGSILWDFYVPSAAYTSAYYEVYNFTNPTNDRIKCGRYYNPQRGDLIVGDNVIVNNEGLFGSGSDTPSQISVDSYVHFYIDCGGNVAPYTTSLWVMQNMKVRRYDRDTSDYTDFPFTVYQYGNVIWCTVPMAESPLSRFSLVLTVPSLYSEQLNTANICFNYVWAWIDNNEVSSLNRSLEPSGYNNAYYASNSFFNYTYYTDDVTQEIINEYRDVWYSQGYTAGSVTIGDSEYRRGYADALNAYGQNNFTIRSVIMAIPDGLVNMLRSLFDFEFLGYNLFNFFKFLFALLAIALTVRLIMRII